MKKRVVLYILWALSIAISIYLMLENQKKTEAYKDYYNYSAEQILREELNYTSTGKEGGTHFYGESEEVSTNMKTGVRDFTGIKDIGDVKFNTSKIEIIGEIKSGKLKILVTDMEDKVIKYEEMGAEPILLVLPNGEGKIKLIGENASADIFVECEQIIGLSETVDYTDLKLNEILKKQYGMESLSDLFIYFNGDTLYMDYYFDRQVSEEQYEKIIRYNEDYAVLGKISLEDVVYGDVFKLGETDVPWEKVRIEFKELVKSATYMGKPNTVMTYSNIDRILGTFDLMKQN